MSWLAKLLAETALEIGRSVARFTRKRTKREQLQDDATWTRPHMGCGEAPYRCVVCGNAPVSRDSPCPGPPATQAARARLREGKQ